MSSSSTIPVIATMFAPGMHTTLVSVVSVILILLHVTDYLTMQKRFHIMHVSFAFICILLDLAGYKTIKNASMLCKYSLRFRRFIAK